MSERTADLSRRHTVRVVGPRPGHGDRRQAHHLPADGRGHRRRRGRSASGSAAPSGARRCRTKRLASAGLGRARARCAGPGRRRAFGLDDDVFAALVARHGGETPAVLALAVGAPRAPRAPGAGPAPAAGGGAVGGAPRDGHDRRRRPVAPHPRRRCAGPGPRPRRRRAWPTLLAPEWGRDPADAARDAAAFAEQARARPAPPGSDAADVP